MPLFEYQALDPRGRRRSGQVTAEGMAQAKEALGREGLYPTLLREGGALRQAQGMGGRVTRADLAAVARQLATLLRAGLPVVGALDALVEQVERPGVRRALAGVRDRVNQGSSLHQALAPDPSFPPLFTQMVRAGEAGGFLDQVMERLAGALEQEERLAGRVRGALAYPVLMTVLGVLFLLFLFAYVVPQVVGIFADYGRQLPLATRILLELSDFAGRFWYLLAGLPLLAVFLYRQADRSERFGLSLDGAKLRLPVVGSLILRAATVRLGYVLGTLLASGVPMLSAMETARMVVGNRHLAAALERAAEAVRQGESLATALRATGAFPPLLARVAGVGEKSGDLPRMLTGVAQSYEEELGRRLSTAVSLLAPLLILVMGGVVLFVVVAVLLPLFQLNQLVGAR